MDVSDCFGYQRCTLPDTQRLLTLTIMQLGSLRNFPPATTNYGGFCSGFPRPFVWILQGFEARLFHVELAAVGRSCGKSRATTFEVLDRKLPTKPYGLWLLRAGGVFVRLVNGVGLDAFRKEEGMPNFRTHGRTFETGDSSGISELPKDSFWIFCWLLGGVRYTQKLVETTSYLQFDSWGRWWSKAMIFGF